MLQDALLYTTLPIYPSLGQAPNMLACTPGGLVLAMLHRTKAHPINNQIIIDFIKEIQLITNCNVCYLNFIFALIIDFTCCFYYL